VIVPDAPVCVRTSLARRSIHDAAVASEPAAWSRSAVASGLDGGMRQSKERFAMMTAIVHFPLPRHMSAADVKAAFEQSAPLFRGVPGLIRKYYLHGADGTGGGVYLWETREAAEAMYSDAWRRRIAERFGEAPEILFFETPVIVDNSVPADPAAATGS